MWVKLDDNFPDHPKVEKAGPAGAWLYVAGLCYCGKHLTDGRIPKSKVPRLTALPNVPKLVAKLLEVALWEEAGDEYVVHDWAIYNPSKAKVEAKREATRNRVETWRKARDGNAVTNSQVTASATQAVTPPPTRPDPTREQEAKEPAPSAPPPRARKRTEASEVGGRVLARVNALAGTAYRASPHLEARVAEGVPEADLLAVVESLARDPFWLGTVRLKPSALFRPEKFPEHLGAARGGAPRSTTPSAGAAYRPFED